MLTAALGAALLAAPVGVMLERFGTVCQTSLVGDTSHAKCDDWCGDDPTRCDYCRCRACANCAGSPADGSSAAAAVTPAMIAAAVMPPSVRPECSHPHEPLCEEFCSPFKGDHCASCRCASCPWCAAYQAHDAELGPPTTMLRFEDCTWVHGMKMRDVEQKEYCSGISQYGRAQCELHVTKWQLGERAHCFAVPTEPSRPACCSTVAV